MYLGKRKRREEDEKQKPRQREKINETNKPNKTRSTDVGGIVEVSNPQVREGRSISVMEWKAQCDTVHAIKQQVSSLP